MTITKLVKTLHTFGKILAYCYTKLIDFILINLLEILCNCHV